MDEICCGLPDLFSRRICHRTVNYNPHLNISAMKQNMGSADRIIRTVAALTVAVLYFAGIISGTVAIILGVLAAVFILTSLIGTCPLYLPVGLSTKKE